LQEGLNLRRQDKVVSLGHAIVVNDKQVCVLIEPDFYKIFR
jgi:hypothetical protein